MTIEIENPSSTGGTKNQGLKGQRNPESKTVLHYFNPLSPNSVQDQFSPYNYPYTVKR